MKSTSILTFIILGILPTSSVIAQQSETSEFTGTSSFSRSFSVGDVVSDSLEFSSIPIELPKFDGSKGTLVSASVTFGVQGQLQYQGQSLVNTGTTAQARALIKVQPTSPNNICSLTTASISSTIDAFKVFTNEELATGDISFNFNDSKVLEIQPSALESLTGTGTIDNCEASVAGVFNFPFEFAAALPLTISKGFTVTVSITYTFESNEEVVACDIADKGRTFTFQRQGDPRWGEDAYARNNLTTNPDKDMANLGCATSVTSMLLDAYGLSTTPEGKPLNPGEINRNPTDGYLSFTDIKGNERAVYDRNSNVAWEAVAHYGRAGFKNRCVREGGSSTDCANIANRKISWLGNEGIRRKATGDFGAAEIKRIEDEICNGNPVILEVASSGISGRHFVLATGVRRDSTGIVFTSQNPGREDGANLPLLSDKIRGYRLFRQEADPNMIAVRSSSNVNFLITDPSGRRLGTDPSTNSFFNEIPGAVTDLISIGSVQPGSESVTTDSSRYAYLPNGGELGNYQIQTFPNQPNADFFLTINSMDINGNTNEFVEENGLLQPGQVVETNLSHTDEELPEAEIGLDTAFFKRIKLSVYKGSRKRPDSFFVRGKLKRLDGEKIRFSFDSEIAFRLGELIVRFEPSELRFFGRKKKRAIGRKDGFFVFLDHRGRFVISGQQEDIFAKAKSESFEFLFESEGIRATKEIKLRCRKRFCKGR